ncbi:MAG: RNA-binding transcriptional accessory protein, partial [Ignavibacteria bacterium]|nr:RNA-binding transcriptional accessory protein [Ignavibacteria bacterium]
MLDIPDVLAHEFSLESFQVQNALALFSEGATIPFVARYRKERTGGLNEIQLRNLADRFTYLTELQDRKRTVVESITAQGKLTDELRARIEGCTNKTALEDLYLPYKPKRRTRATTAREKGLEGLAAFIMEKNIPGTSATDLEGEAKRYVSIERGVASPEEALAGASDILAEQISERADLRAPIRRYLLEEGAFVSTIRDTHAAGTTKFEMYRSFSARTKEIAPHNILALYRGE